MDDGGEDKVVTERQMFVFLRELVWRSVYKLISFLSSVSIAHHSLSLSSLCGRWVKGRLEMRSGGTVVRRGGCLRLFIWPPLNRSTLIFFARAMAVWMKRRCGGTNLPVLHPLFQNLC